MKKKFKICLSCIMVLMIFILALPVGAFAATEYGLYVNGEQFTSDKLTINCGSGTAIFVPATNTLTLNNANITKGYILKIVPDPYNPENYSNEIKGIYSTLGTLKLVVNGNNTISTSETDESSVLKLRSISGICCDGDLEISGNGKLNINMSDIYCNSEVLWLNAIQVENLTVTDATINASVKNASLMHATNLIFNAISTAWDCTLNNCNITAKCDVNHPYREGSPHVSGGMSITGNITLNNSNITAFGNTVGVLCDTFNGNGGSVTASSKSSVSDYSTGFSAFTLNLNGTTIKATSQNAEMSKAVAAYFANIKSGTIISECIGSSAYSYGIWGYTFNMDGGFVSAKACPLAANGTESYGIKASTSFKISGGDLVASGYKKAIYSESYNVSEYDSPQIFVANTVNSANAAKTENAQQIETALYAAIYSQTHSHTFSNSWKYDEAGHWHEAICGHTEKSGYAAHNFSGAQCSACGYKMPVSSVESVDKTSSMAESIIESTVSTESNVNSDTSDLVSDVSSAQDVITSDQGNAEQEPADLTMLWVGISAVAVVGIAVATILIIKKKK